MFTVNVNTCRGSNSTIYVIVSLLSRDQILEERILFQQEQILLTLSWKVFFVQQKQTGIHKSYFPLYIWQRNMAVYPYTFMEEKKEK